MNFRFMNSSEFRNFKVKNLNELISFKVMNSFTTFMKMENNQILSTVLETNSFLKQKI